MEPVGMQSSTSRVSRKGLDLLLNATGLIVMGAAIPMCIVNTLGGSSIPTGIVLWTFLSLLARLVMQLTGRLFGDRDRSLILAALYLLFVVPSACIALISSTGKHVDPTRACINQLRQLAGAKETWVFETKRQVGTVVRWEDIIGAEAFIKTRPVCPHGGVYSLGNVGEPPRCSLESEGHRLSDLY